MIFKLLPFAMFFALASCQEQKAQDRQDIGGKVPGLGDEFGFGGAAGESSSKKWKNTLWTGKLQSRDELSLDPVKVELKLKNTQFELTVVDNDDLYVEGTWGISDTTMLLNVKRSSYKSFAEPDDFPEFRIKRSGNVLILTGIDYTIKLLREGNSAEESANLNGSEDSNKFKKTDWSANTANTAWGLKLTGEKEGSFELRIRQANKVELDLKGIFQKTTGAVAAEYPAFLTVKESNNKDYLGMQFLLKYTSVDGLDLAVLDKNNEINQVVQFEANN